jgi:hypothetical protein
MSDVRRKKRRSNQKTITRTINPMSYILHWIQMYENYSHKSAVAASAFFCSASTSA